MNKKHLHWVRNMCIKKKGGRCATLNARGGADGTREYRSPVDMEATYRVYMYE
jgi:hypothetical protein